MTTHDQAIHHMKMKTKASNSTAELNQKLPLFLPTRLVTTHALITIIYQDLAPIA